MAFSLNKIMLIGNLGQDAENRFTNNNVSVTSFSIATTYSYKGKDGNWVNETTWHNVVGFNLSDFLKDKLKKGAKFYVEGRLSKRSYEDKEGKKQYFTEVIADSYSGLIPLDPASGGGNYESNNSQSSESSAPAESKAEDDDLPF
ncbi:MAG: single-stranded DNA-binding protein [Melioribacteraceae bacterium]|nr:single-stranded DNA-binding protein [Melioribacteraceae bacterium]MCF8352936.1 single-stranded DNA-binding protein [Melioribacteraceae bacterium]MCF8395872.1 single-stranded DNA-binding protein [Melioribacteraceae bacterium]MCF8417453.1 single-stranded DNA-binding protein [Melioribacteraceae bacterium]